jgi:hypothetical protein
MCFLPAHRNFSWDVLRNPALRSGQTQAWSLWILPLMMGIVYVYGAIAKMNPDWLLDANPLHDWLRYRKDMPLLGPLWAQKETAFAMAWGGMLLDLTAPFLLAFRKTRGWALCLVLLFHLTNTLVFQIGIFPWLSIALSLLYFPPGWPRQAWAFAKRKAKWPNRVEAWWGAKLNADDLPDAGPTPPAYPAHFVKTGLAALLAFHLLVPLRHWCFPGDVAWTEEGHRYSWRMMLRSKRGHGRFEVKDPSTGEVTKVDARDYLSDRQLEKIFTHPDMKLQFAHHLRDEWKRRGVPGAEVRARIKVGLNGRTSAVYIDPDVDLARVHWQPFAHSGWVLPMVAPGADKRKGRNQ